MRQPISLINPVKTPTYQPLNLAFLAGYLRKFGQYQYDIKIFDACFQKDLIPWLQTHKPRLIGITTFSPDILNIYDLAQNIRKQLPPKSFLLVAGGVHATLHPREAVENGFDVAVVGEGEQAFTELADRYCSAPTGNEDFSAIKGIVYRGQSGDILTTAPRELISDLDQIPHPARDLLLNSNYHKRFFIMRGMGTSGVYTVHGARGCPFHCIFCCVNFAVPGKVRRHSASFIADEVEILVKQYRARWIYFTDDTFFVDKAHADELCKELIRRDLHKRVKWEVQIRSNLIKDSDLDLLRLMKKAGCRQVDIGFESGNQRMLTLIKGPGIRLEDHQRAIDILYSVGIHVLGTFILGSPTETFQEMCETRDFILKNYKKMANYQLGHMLPFPGTRVYQMAVQDGLVHSDYLTQLRRQQTDDRMLVCSKNLTQSEVEKMEVELMYLAARKINWIQKAKWLSYNLFINPRTFFDGLSWMWKIIKANCCKNKSLHLF
jgi:radical SAM superfamily enzyme YgiQ (UPF0313 family)